MHRARAWNALLAISLLLVTGTVQGIGEVRPGERKALLDLLVQVIGDSNTHRESAKVLSRRYSERAALRSADPASAPRASSRRPIEIFSRDPSLKDKFINHFTGPVTFSPECNKHFIRVYHNTKDCSTPLYYKRCARLLTRLAKSSLCSRP
ncbi:ALK and LTK ligand 1 [Xenopus tropicalis]|nr:ALK and LTK ligand 1 [Xenopus tropicalis]